jgi:hypothetical protein
MTVAQPIRARSNGNFTIHNFMPEFWHFWEAAKSEPPDKQMELWRSVYLKPHQAVFADLAEVCKAEFDAGRMRARYFPSLPTLIPAIHALADRLPDELSRAKQNFFKTLPDMNWSGDVYVLASAGCFNGRAQKIQNTEALLLGLDTMAALGETNLVALLHHELFHRYHHQFFAFEPDSRDPLWVELWTEGLATYAARLLNPSASNRETLALTDAEIATLRKGVAQIAADFLSRFHSLSPDDSAAYFEHMGKKTEVPRRAGYYLGLRVAQQLAVHNSLEVMAHWSREQAEGKIRASLDQLADAGDGARPN